MKQDKELIRDMLRSPSKYEGRKLNVKEKVQLDLLSSGNLIEGKKMFGDGTFEYERMELTYEGYELLSGISNQSVWDEVKKKVELSGLTLDEVPLEVIKELAYKIIKDKLI